MCDDMNAQAGLYIPGERGSSPGIVPTSYYYYLDASGLCCCPRAFSGYTQPGLLLVAACRLLVAVASLVAEHRPRRAGSVPVVHGLGCREARGVLVPRPGMEHVPPALASRFFTTGPLGKSPCLKKNFFFLIYGMWDLSSQTGD